MTDQVGKQNTDRELWREREGDYYAPSLHVTQGGGIGMDVGGHVVVKPIREWHALVSWKCKAQPTADPPQDCDWPHCGCDPHAQEVIERLIESGWASPDEAFKLRDQVARAHELLSNVAGVVKDGEQRMPVGIQERPGFAARWLTASFVQEVRGVVQGGEAGGSVMRRHCACLHDDALDCARERYGDDTDEPCDCVCHDGPEDDDLETRPGSRAPDGALTAAGEGERHG